MMHIDPYIEEFTSLLSLHRAIQPWELLASLEELLVQKIATLGDDYIVEQNIAIHKSATIEQGVILKGAIIISAHCHVGAHAYLRGPILLRPSGCIGPSSEIKHSVIFDNTTIAHFNYIGNSLIGKQVNFEAGAVCANHYNERTDKKIVVSIQGNRIDTHTEKFGSVVGDNSKIGANAVLSPGTVLAKNSIVKRLELIDQDK